MKTMNLIRRMLVPGLMAALVPLALAEVKDLGEGSMQVVSGGDDTRILTLKHTEVKAEISGFVAEVRVTQVFANPAEGPIEAVYVFPLPENAAVNEMELKVGDRTIKGQIKKKEEARKIYEDAKAQGKTAALLDQERPNIFTQSVANIPPGKEIKVSLKYIQNLDYDHGVYKFTFPMTVGPRYIPGEAKGKKGGGWADDTDEVPDASLITPPVVAPGQRSGRDISVEVKLNAGLPIKNIRSSSHEIAVKSVSEREAEVGLDAEDRIPNKDFLLTYEPAVRAVNAAVLAHKDGREGYFTLMVQPNADFPLSQITPKELVFALDVSGSMGGFPIETAKEVALRCLEGMNPGDTFQVFTFASGNQLHFERPLANTPFNVARGREAINSLRGGGGTEMLDALKKVLEFPKDPERLRIVLFMTDGFIGNDPQILGFVKEHLNGSRIFPLGVGSSPNRYLLDELAVMGKGTVEYVRQDEKPAKLEKMIERFYDRISRPVLTDLAVDWNGLEVLDVSPAVTRDLFAGQPVFLHGRYHGSGKATVTLSAKLRGKPWKMPVSVDLPARETANAALGPLWARSRITELSRGLFNNADDGLIAQVTRLGLEHQLVTQYTSFVAVDDGGTKFGQKPMLVQVASELPEGTRHEGFFGRAGAAVRGAMSQAKASPAGYSYSAGFGCRDGSGGTSLAAEKKNESAPANSVANLAGQFLTAPSRRLARQLLSLQDDKGFFLEPGGDKATVADHALALLALVKARTLYGAEMDGAVKAAWTCLRDRTEGSGGRETVANALKSGPHSKRAVVTAELAALAAELEKLK